MRQLPRPRVYDMANDTIPLDGNPLPRDHVDRFLRDNDCEKRGGSREFCRERVRAKRGLDAARQTEPLLISLR